MLIVCSGVYKEHWCWSGTNSKGKWGIFPQSHIDPHSLTVGAASADRASVYSRERKHSVFSRMANRKPGL